MSAITGNAIAHFQLAVWKSALRLEKVGMKRRGQSVRKIVQEHFNMPKATCDQLINRIDEELNKCA